MSGPWRVVDLTGYKGLVVAGNGHLQVADAGEVALADVVAMLTGVSCELHASVFDGAASYGIPLLHCDWRGVPVAATYSWSSHTRAGARQRAQAELSVPRQKNAWMHLVQGKIRGQASVLNALGRDAGEQLLELARRVRSGDPANLEGQAARLYWTRVFGDRSFRRLPGSRSGANGMLDYGYAILRGACLRGVVSAGLTPGIGIWHRRRDNAFALVDDVIEPFRPAVDRIVVEIFESGSGLGRDEKRRLAGVLDEPMNQGGVTVNTAVDRLSQQLGRYVEGEVARLVVPSFEAFRAAR